MIFLYLAAGALVVFGLAVAIHRADPQSPLHRSAGAFGALLAFCLAVESYNAGTFESGSASWWGQAVGWAGVNLLAAAVLHMVASFVAVKLRPWVRRANGALFLLLAAGSFTPLLVQDVRYDPGPPARQIEVLGPLIGLEIAAMLWVVIAATALLAYAVVRAPQGMERRRAKVWLTGWAVTGIGFFVSFLLMVEGHSELTPYLYFWALPFLLSLMIAAGRYGAFDLDGVARRFVLNIVRAVVLAAGLAIWVSVSESWLGELTLAARVLAQGAVVAVLWSLDRATVRFGGPLLDGKSQERMRALADLALSLTSTAEGGEVASLARRLVAQQLPGAKLQVVTSKATLAKLSCLAEVGGVIDAERLAGDPRLAPFRLTLEMMSAVLGADVLVGATWSDKLQAVLAVSLPPGRRAGVFDLAFLVDTADLIAGPLSRSTLMEHVVQLNSELVRNNAALEQRVGERTVELIQAHQKMVGAQKELSQKDRMAGLGQLSAGVAHEINNPLACVTQNLKTLGKMAAEVSDPRLAEADEIVSESLDAAARIARIVRDLRRAAAVVEAPRVPVNLRELVQTEVHRVANESPGARMELDLDDVGEVPLCAEDIALAVTHLLRNATQSGATRVSVSLRKSEATIVLRVADDGRGIEADSQRRMFDPFGKIGAVGEGRGLGLAVAAGIARRHSGTLEVFSQPGKGATFEMTLLAGQVPREPDRTVN